MYKMIAIATDNNPSWSAEAMVVVEVQDENDNFPVVAVNSLTAFETSSLSVQENMQKEQFVAHISVFDADSDANGVVECSLSMLASQPRSLFSMSALNNHHSLGKRGFVGEEHHSSLGGLNVAGKGVRKADKRLSSRRASHVRNDYTGEQQGGGKNTREYHVFSTNVTFDRETESRLACLTAFNFQISFLKN